MVTISRAEYDAQQGRIAKLEQQVAVLTEALRLSRHRQFGASSEKMSEDVIDQLSFLFNEAEAYNDVAQAEEESTPVAQRQGEKQLCRTGIGILQSSVWLGG